MNRLLFVCSMAVLCLFLAGTILPAAAQSVLVTGTVEAVAPDGSSITVDGQSIATDQQFIDDYLMETRRIADQVAARDDLNAVQKVLTISAGFSSTIKDKKGIVVSLHEDRNAQLHVMIEKRSMTILLPPYKKIIEQGIEEGFFQTDFPEEAIISLISATSVILDTPEEVSEVVDRPVVPGSSGWTERMERNIEALFDITEKLLGAKKGTFKEQAEKMKK